MTKRDGAPIWYDLMTDTPDAAQTFYGSVMGWTFAKMPDAPGQDYRTITAPDGEGVGGVMKKPERADFSPVWAVYIGVSDVDAMAKKVTSLGGRVHMAPQDIPGVGRFAYVQDPQGAMFYLMRGDSDQDSTAFAPAKTGHCSWNELVTSDQKAALAFYSALFGWDHGGAMPMGDNGDYTFLLHNGDMIGAVMDDFEESNQPYWNFAFQVADIDAAKDAVEKAGGTVRMGPSELPDGQDWLIQVTDPQGAKIMFSGPRNEHAG